MVETLFYDKPHRKNMKNLQTKLYLALFSDFEYLVPLQSNEIFFRISSEKTYCICTTIPAQPSVTEVTRTWQFSLKTLTQLVIT